MLQTNLNNFFIITSVVVGLFAILLIWVYLWETSRGLKITEIQIYKNYVNCSFAFALVMLVILWITTQGLDSKLMICFLIFMRTAECLSESSCSLKLVVWSAYCKRISNALYMIINKPTIKLLP